MSSGELDAYRALRDAGRSEEQALDIIKTVRSAIQPEPIKIQDHEITNKDLKIAIFELKDELKKHFCQENRLQYNAIEMIIETKTSIINEQMGYIRSFMDHKFISLNETLNNKFDHVHLEILDIKPRQALYINEIHKLHSHIKVGYVAFAGIFSLMLVILKFVLEKP